MMGSKCCDSHLMSGHVSWPTASLNSAMALRSVGSVIVCSGLALTSRDENSKPSLPKRRGLSSLYAPVELGAAVEPHVGVGQRAGQRQRLAVAADEGAWGAAERRRLKGRRRLGGVVGVRNTHGDSVAQLEPHAITKAHAQSERATHLPAGARRPASPRTGPPAPPPCRAAAARAWTGTIRGRSGPCPVFGRVGMWGDEESAGGGGRGLSVEIPHDPARVGLPSKQPPNRRHDRRRIPPKINHAHLELVVLQVGQLAARGLQPRRHVAVLPLQQRDDGGDVVEVAALEDLGG
jgi:hypothetical protein